MLMCRRRPLFLKWLDAASLAQTDIATVVEEQHATSPWRLQSMPQLRVH
jgi:hypothetical protein